MKINDFKNIKKTDLLTVSIGIILALTLANSYMTFKLYNKSASIGEENNNEPAANQPSKVQVSAEDDAVKGSKDAPVTIIEFSDYQCPYCERFYTQTFPQIEENYIKTGKVKFVYRDFPLTNLHQYAQKAAEASECADEQGKFWEYQGKLFNNQQSLDTPSLKQYAKDLGLDAAKFNECLDSGKMASEVQKDLKDGQSYGVDGTPAFFINDIFVGGAQPFSVFQQVIDQALKDAK